MFWDCSKLEDNHGMRRQDGTAGSWKYELVPIATFASVEFSKVFSQTIFSCEFFMAFKATKLTCMYSVVKRQLGYQAEMHVAFAADEWFFPGVFHRMLHQIEISYEFLVADRTGIRDGRLAGLNGLLPNIE